VVTDDRHRNFFAQVDSPARVQIDRRLGCSCSSGFGFQALAPLALTLVAIFGLAGCSTNHVNAQSSQTPLLSIALAQLPPATLPVSTSAQVSATVSNDPANAGVDWIATCGSATADCGHFTPTHTDSGAATTFWAPRAVPPHKTIAVTALSTTDHSKASAFSVTLVSTVTSITITQFPPSTAPAGSTITLSASVVGDPANLGVDWTANCGGINCTVGFQYSNTPPGQDTKFVIPLPTDSGFQGIVGSTVTITAYAAADHSYNAVATLVVGNPILVNMTQLPPSTMLTSATATVTAVVENDPTNSGVIWQASCQFPPCGTFNPSQTASGAPTVYTAPPVLQANSTSMGVTIVAQAVAAPRATIQTGVTIILPISVKITQPVTSGTIVQGHSASLVATVANDPASAGVDWSVTCSGLASCGTFSPTHTASGSPTTYTAPATATAGSVTITATSTADSTKTDTQPNVAVTTGTPPNSLLHGKFVMLLSSENSQNGAYVVGGVISGNANSTPDTNGGTITDATLDLVDASSNSGSSIHTLSPSTYSIGLDGRGQIKLLIDIVTLNRNFGVTGPASPCGSTPNCGSLTLSVVFVSPQHAILSESDSFGTASGTLDLQNLQGLSVFSPGVYSLSLSGSEISRPTAGYFVASAVTIPSTTGYSYVTDQSDDGAITSVPFTTSTQAFVTTGFDTNGNLSGSSINLGLPTKHLNFWAIDATHFVVTDLLDSLASFTTLQVVVSGRLTLQPSSPTISGTYAFTETGATAAAQPQVAGGILACGSAGTLDVVPLSGTVLANQVITATCGAVAKGRSLIAMTGAASSGINQFAAYPTVDQGLYFIELDGGASGTSGSSGAGVALQQTLSPPIASASLNGKYAANFSATTAAGAQAFAVQIGADGVSALTGIGDVNSYNATAAIPVATPSLGAGFSGTYSSASDGRFPFTLTITPASGQPSPQITNLHLACHLVDAKTCMLLGMDATAPGTGMLLLQNTGL
jgi:hypothetical protein